LHLTNDVKDVGFWWKNYQFGGSLESVAVLRFSGESQEAYNTGILQFWYLSMDTHSTLLHVKIEVRLFISVLRKEGYFEIVEFKTDRFSKSQKGSQMF
jgi:hypothetical protein